MYYKHVDFFCKVVGVISWEFICKFCSFRSDNHFFYTFELVLAGPCVRSVENLSFFRVLGFLLSGFTLLVSPSSYPSG